MSWNKYNFAFIVIIIVTSCQIDNSKKVKGIWTVAPDEAWVIHKSLDINDWVPFQSDLSGKYNVLFPNDSVEVTGQYVNGIATGTFGRYWQNGVIRDYVEIENGSLDGLQYIQDSLGNLRYLAHYSKNYMEYMKAYNKEGELIDSYMSIYKKGEIVNKNTYLRGETISFELGLTYTALQNPIFHLSILDSSSDTLYQNKTKNMGIPIYFKIEKPGEHNLEIVLEEIDARDNSIQGVYNEKFSVLVE